MPTYTAPGVYVVEVPSAIMPIAGVGTSTAAFVGVSADITTAWDPTTLTGMPVNLSGVAYTQVAAMTPKAVNSWTEFIQNFGDIQAGNEYLAQAVFGFFNNGGTRCWVVRVAAATDDLTPALALLEAIDEIAIVAAPLPPDPTVTAQALNAAQAAVIAHCEKMEDRVAILDSGLDIAGDNLVITTDATGIWKPAAEPNGYGAFYFPWIFVADPLNGAGARVAVPPSGHIAGIYARSDAQRGVQKAPANELILGALDVRYPVSKILQSSLNPYGVNCIRSFNGTIKVYGARTLASDPQGGPEWIYVSVRRLVNFLRESIDEGTQWAVFEPNAPELWSKLRRNLSAFLNAQWAAGALVGATPAQAFYVLCDETNNTPDVQAQGQVVADVGIAVVRPAEFVIFRLSQWAGPGQ